MSVDSVPVPRVKSAYVRATHRPMAGLSEADSNIRKHNVRKYDVMKDDVMRYDVRQYERTGNELKGGRQGRSEASGYDVEQFDGRENDAGLSKARMNETNRSYTSQRVRHKPYDCREGYDFSHTGLASLNQTGLHEASAASGRKGGGSEVEGEEPYRSQFDVLYTRQSDQDLSVSSESETSLPELSQSEPSLTTSLTEPSLSQVSLTERGQSKVSLTELGQSKVSLTEVGQSKVSLTERGQSKVSLTELGQSKVSLTERGQSKVSLTELGQSKVSLTERGQSKVSLSERGQSKESLTEQGQSKVSLTEQGRSQVSLTERGQSKVSLTQPGKSKVSLTWTGQSQVSLNDLPRSEVSLTELCESKVSLTEVDLSKMSLYDPVRSEVGLTELGQFENGDSDPETEVRTVRMSSGALLSSATLGGHLPPGGSTDSALTRDQKKVILQRLLRDVTLEGTLSKYRRLPSHAAQREHPEPTSSVPPSSLRRTSKHKAGMSSNDIWFMADRQYMSRLEAQLESQYQAEMDKKEEERADLERQRMRRLFVEGVIGPEELKKEGYTTSRTGHTARSRRANKKVRNIIKLTVNKKVWSPRHCDSAWRSKSAPEPKTRLQSSTSGPASSRTHAQSAVPGTHAPSSKGSPSKPRYTGSCFNGETQISRMGGDGDATSATGEKQARFRRCFLHDEEGCSCDSERTDRKPAFIRRHPDPLIEALKEDEITVDRMYNLADTILPINRPKPYFETIMPGKKKLTPAQERKRREMALAGVPRR